MARSRDYAAEYARRQELARERGFENAYEQRIRGGAGASPRAPRPEGIELTRARGHRADYYAQIKRDIIDRIEPGAAYRYEPLSSNFSKDENDNWRELHISVALGPGDMGEIVLYDVSQEEIDLWIDLFDDAGAVPDPNYDLAEL